MISIPVNKIAKFAEVYEEVYKSVRLEQLSKDTPFVMMRGSSVVEAFENKYDVNLIRVNEPSGVQEMMFSFDTVDFKTEENMTMCLLKWS